MNEISPRHFSSEELLKNITKRTELMFRNKCTEEVKNFLKLKIDNKDFSNKNLIHSLEVIEIIKKIELSFLRKDERIFL